jgi:hypothetical protein
MWVDDEATHERSYEVIWQVARRSELPVDRPFRQITGASGLATAALTKE